MPDDVEVVGDEHVRQAELLLQVLQQVEDLRLHRDVQRRDGLVAEDELRVDGEGARDADALPLPAGELVREPVVVLRVEPDDLEELLHAPLALGRSPDPVHLEGFRDREADALPRVQGRVRVLEDHHHVSADRPHLLPGQLRDVLAAEDEPARRRLEQLEDAAHEGRLAAARLADDAERLSPTEGEGDPVHGLHGRDLLLEDDSPRDREVLLQVLDDEQFLADFGLLVEHGRRGAQEAASAVKVVRSAAASRAFVASSRWHACRCLESYGSASRGGTCSMHFAIA